MEIPISPKWFVTISLILISISLILWGLNGINSYDINIVLPNIIKISTGGAIIFMTIMAHFLTS